MPNNCLHAFDFSEAAPVFVKKLKDQKIRDGDTVILTCSVEGQPRPQITWSRNGVEILDNQVSQPPPPACGGMRDVEVMWSYKKPEFTKTHEHVKYQSSICLSAYLSVCLLIWRCDLGTVLDLRKVCAFFKKCVLICGLVCLSWGDTV